MKLIDAYKRLPKVVRFVLQFCTAPVWFPLLILASVIWTPIVAIVEMVVEAWEDFE